MIINKKNKILIRVIEDKPIGTLIDKVDYLKDYYFYYSNKNKKITQILEELTSIYYEGENLFYFQFIMTEGWEENFKKIVLKDKFILKALKDIKKGWAYYIPIYEQELQQLSKTLVEGEKLKVKIAEQEVEIARLKKIKIGKYKRSGHLTDQMLKYTYPKDNKGQPSLFDSLEDATKKAIETVGGVEVTEIVEGIKLSPSETKVIDCLCKLLHENSQTFDPKKEDYYSGNKGFELVEFGGDKNTPAPKLAFTLYELTKEYKAGEYVGGKDIDNVKQILTELDNKKFLLSYVETTKTKGGGRVERKIEDFRKLIHIVKISQTEFNKEDIELSKLEETIVVLNPIFRRQIDSKFILYPNDINKRTIIAYGSHNLSEIALRLRDYLIRELSSKHYKPEINLDKLFYLLAEKWMRESRKTKVKEYTEKALETVKTLGLIENYEIKTGATGEPKVIFTLNKDWE